MCAFGYSKEDIEKEVDRLFAQLKNVGWSRGECEYYAPWTLKIRNLAKEKDAIILAHSYQTPDILFGIADFRGDSLGLSIKARDTKAKMIVFCGVRFMAETAKVLSPDKVVLHPAPDAGCSLSESCTGEDVRRLRVQYPNAKFVCYVNTTAEVKAECDVVCTSANALAIVEGVDGDEIVFLPDELMGRNLQKMTKKKIHIYNGRCIVHETFTKEMALQWKETYPDAKMLVHTEARPEVVELADLAGGTGDMIRYVRESPPSQKRFMLVTECGLSDRLRVEFPDKEFIGTCSLCPHMKRVDLMGVLQALENPSREQIVEVPEDVAKRARKAIEKMFEIMKRGASETNMPHSSKGEASGRCE